MVAIGGYKIRSVAVGRDSDNFLLREAAEIKDFALGIPGKTFRNEIFFLAHKSQTGVSFHREIAMNSFDELGEFAGSAQASKFRVARGVKAFTESDTFFQKLKGFEIFAEMLVSGSERIENRTAVGKVRLKLFKES